MYGGLCSGLYLQGLLHLRDLLGQRKVNAAVSFMFNESLITRGRNALAHGFLKTDCTHLFFIDADIRFDAAEAVAMFDADKDIICGIYPKKEINWETVRRAMDAGVPTDDLKHHTGSFVVNLVGDQNEVTVPMNQPVEIWNGGTGFMLIKRGVFESMIGKVPTYKNDMNDLSGSIKPAEEIHEFFATSIDPQSQRLLSEDYHFCKTWRDLGGKVYAAPWVNLGHIGTYIFEGQLLRQP